jgi:hypothetical protein
MSGVASQGFAGAGRLTEPLQAATVRQGKTFPKTPNPEAVQSRRRNIQEFSGEQPTTTGTRKRQLKNCKDTEQRGLNLLRALPGEKPTPPAA